MSSETLSPMNIVVPPVHGALQDRPRRLLVDFFQPTGGSGSASSWRLITKKRTPQGEPRGAKGKPFFEGHAGSRWLGRPFKTPQPATLVLRASAAHRSVASQWWAGRRPGRLVMREPASPFFRGLGDWSRRSRTTPSPRASLHPDRSSRRCVWLFAESVYPSDHVGETFDIPSTSLTIPSVLHPEGLRFPGILLG